MNDFFTNLPRDERAEIPAPPASATVDPKLKKLCNAKLLSLDGVEGWAPQGDDSLTVYVRDAGVAQSLPGRLGGRTVRPVVSGEVRTF